jgi:hypothetical protein
MKKGALFSLFLCLCFIFSIEPIAWADCVPDGNNSSVDADTISTSTMVTGVVCPDDPYDYYTFDVVGTADLSGNITLEASETGTTFRITGPGGVLYEGNSTDTDHTLTAEIYGGDLPEGTYYLRVAFYSSYPFEHNYTLTTNLIGATHPAPPTPAPFAATSGPIVAPIGPAMLLVASPWPTPEGGADNANRSSFNGPGAASLATGSYNILSDVGLGAARDGRFTGLVTGPGGMIYVFDNDADRIIAYKAGSGSQWQKQTNGMGPCLDSLGHVLFVNPGGQLESLNPDGSSRWTAAIPHAGSGYVCTVGSKIYVLSIASVSQSYLTAFNLAGTEAWDAGPYDAILSDVAEDASGNVIIRSSTFGLIFKGSDGATVWSMTFAGGLGSVIPSPLQDIGPVAGKDGRVWLTTPTAIFAIGGASGGWTDTYHVMSTDGLEYKTVSVTAGVIPMYVCYGNDNMFYVLDKSGTLTCYSDWSDAQWTLPMEAGTTVRDMIIGGNNNIYLLATVPTMGTTAGYQYHLLTVDANTHSIVGNRDLGVPASSVSAPGELAIGEGGNIIMLNSEGYLEVIAAVTSAPAAVHLDSIVAR